MRKAFLILSVSSRLDDLRGLVQSIRSLRRFDDYTLNLMFQDPEGVADQLDRAAFDTLLVHPELLGCHAARVRLLKAVQADAYVNLDDDMTLCEWTDYERAIAKALEPTTGFVLTNWARTMAQVAAKVPKMRDAFVKQVLIYQGGGMVYRNEIADLMRALPEVGQTFDHSWPLTAYVKGYTNYRYLGSLAEHRTLGSGGMKAYMKGREPELLMAEYINFRQAKRGEGASGVCIPLDSDLTELAHQHHRQNSKDRPMAPRAPYHTALSHGRTEEAAPLTGRYEAGGDVVLRWDVADGPPPADYHSCDVLYADPAWPAGLAAFNARAGIEVLDYPTYATAIGRAIAALNKPTAMATSPRLLRYTPAPDMTTEVLLNGGKATLAFWNGAYAGGATTVEVLEALAKTYRRVGDFCAGYGLAGRVFKRAGGSFVMSDYNADCCGYIAAHMGSWGP